MDSLLPSVLNRFGLARRGVLHVGANEGQEADLYNDLGFERVFWIEADPDIFPRLLGTLRSFPSQTAYCALLADKDGEAIPFYVSNNNGGSSSLLPFNKKKMAELFPGLDVQQEKVLSTERLESFIARHQIQVGSFNVLNIDVQGAELLVLKGAGDLLLGLDLICLEVRLARDYIGSSLLHEVDLYLIPEGFRRVRTSALGAEGEAYYLNVRRHLHLLEKAGMVLGSLALELSYQAGITSFFVRRKRAFPFIAALYHKFLDVDSRT